MKRQTEVGSARRSLPNDTPRMMLTVNVLHPFPVSMPMPAVTAGPSLFPPSFARRAIGRGCPNPVPAGLRRERRRVYRVPPNTPDKVAPVSYPGGVFNPIRLRAVTACHASLTVASLPLDSLSTAVYVHPSRCSSVTRLTTIHFHCAYRSSLPSTARD